MNSGSSPSPGRLWWRKFFIRCRHWEYWPMYVFNFPVLFIWMWNAVRARNLFFFTMTNPGIETGGFFGESKSGIMSMIPENFKPVTCLLRQPVNMQDIEKHIQDHQLTFPLIAKPEIGERGWKIEKLTDQNALGTYLKENTFDIILQPFLEWPEEVSIMVYRMPDTGEVQVTSVCQKEFLSVKGDGVSTLEQLILKKDRAVLQYERLNEKWKSMWNNVPEVNQYILLEPIGNHSRGTLFRNQNHLIDEKLTSVMGRLLSSMPGVYYGRFDMKIRSWAELLNGEGIAVMEFNGTSSDPAHIYDPAYPLWRAYRDIAQHWKIMRSIAGSNRKAGVRPDRFKKIISALVIYFRYKSANKDY